MKRHRALTGRERAVIERLLSVEFPEVEYFQAQIPALTVTDVCDCGCGTLRFSGDAEKASRAPSPAWNGSGEPIVEGDSQSWMMLFQADDWLTELEHVAGYGPNPEELDASGIEPDHRSRPAGSSSGARTGRLLFAQSATRRWPREHITPRPRQPSSSGLVTSSRTSTTRGSPGAAFTRTV